MSKITYKDLGFCDFVSKEADAYEGRMRYAIAKCPCGAPTCRNLTICVETICNSGFLCETIGLSPEMWRVIVADLDKTIKKEFPAQ